MPESTTESGTGGARRRRLRWVQRLGSVFHGGLVAVAAALVLFVVALVYLLAHGAEASILEFGWGFPLSSPWSLPQNLYGGGPAILGTLITSGLAVVLALPVALGVALFASEMVPPRWGKALAYVVDLGAAIPSVVYGFWAFEVIVPFFRSQVEPRLGSSPLGGTLFRGSFLGTDVLSASVILAIMIVPTIAALSREALRAVPRAQREAALGLGATRWEASRMTVLGSAVPGIVGGTVLGLGRAIGETIAVALVIGNNYVAATSLLSTTTTIPSWLVTQFTESYGLERSALFELALLLLVISLFVNFGARTLLARRTLGRARGRLRPRTDRYAARHRSGGAPSSLELPVWWQRIRQQQARRLRRRKVVQLVVIVLALGAVLLAVYPLVSLVDAAVLGGGAAVVQPTFYTSQPPPACGVGQPGGCPLGGIGPEIEGTLVLLGLSGAVGLPIGLLAGIYLSEYGRKRFGQTVGTLVDSLLGVPSILLGIFVFTVFVRLDRPDAQSTLAGASALALLMIPVVAKATETALRSVPNSVREGALALGFPRHRVALRVVLGSARSALITGSLLAIMRAGGETAALVLTGGNSTFWLTSLRTPFPALAPFIYDSLTSNVGSPSYTTDAWGAVLVLFLIIAVVSFAARFALRSGEEGSAV